MARSRSRTRSRTSRKGSRKGKSKSRKGSKQSRSLRRLHKYRKNTAYSGVGKYFEHYGGSRTSKTACGRRTQMECTYNPNCEWAEGVGCRRKADVASGDVQYAGPMRY